MRLNEQLELDWNVKITLIDRGKRKVWHEHTHNIVVNTGRQFILENISPQSLGPSTFVRIQDSVIRYIGLGIGGNRQTDPAASASPLSDTYPAGYGGTNTQTDTDLTVTGLERPVKVTASPDLWMREITTPVSTTATTATYVSVFSQSDINFGSYTSMPLSEIALYKSTADPSLPNGSAGAYPGAGAHTVAYDAFDPVSKTGVFSIEVQWTWRL